MNIDTKSIKSRNFFGKRYYDADDVNDVLAAVSTRMDELWAESSALRKATENDNTEASDEAARLKEEADALRVQLTQSEEDIASLQALLTERQAQSDASIAVLQAELAAQKAAPKGSDTIAALQDRLVAQLDAQQSQNADAIAAHKAMMTAQMEAAQAQSDDMIASLKAQLIALQNQNDEDIAVLHAQQVDQQKQHDLEKRQRELEIADYLEKSKNDAAKISQLTQTIEAMKKETEINEKLASTNTASETAEKADRLIAKAMQESERIIGEATKQRDSLVAANRAVYYSAVQFKMALSSCFNAAERDLDDAMDALRQLKYSALVPGSDDNDQSI